MSKDLRGAVLLLNRSIHNLPRSVSVHVALPFSGNFMWSLGRPLAGIGVPYRPKLASRADVTQMYMNVVQYVIAWHLERRQLERLMLSYEREAGSTRAANGDSV